MARRLSRKATVMTELLRVTRELQSITGWPMYKALAEARIIVNKG